MQMGSSCTTGGEEVIDACARWNQYPGGAMRVKAGWRKPRETMRFSEWRAIVAEAVVGCLEHTGRLLLFAHLA